MVETAKGEADRFERPVGLMGGTALPRELFSQARDGIPPGFDEEE